VTTFQLGPNPVTWAQRLDECFTVWFKGHQTNELSRINRGREENGEQALRFRKKRKVAVEEGAAEGT
jgi:hypothetical protein